MESQSVDPKDCPHNDIRWIEAMTFDEEGKGNLTRYYSCPDCGERGRA